MPDKKKKKKKNTERTVQLPKDALRRVHLGQSFAEYDFALDNPDVWVRTHALAAAMDPTISKCFFVGRRGTGKTAITKFVESHDRKVEVLRPTIFSPVSSPVPNNGSGATGPKTFRSVVSAFRRALQANIIRRWMKDQRVYASDLPPLLREESELISDADFDQHSVQFVQSVIRALRSGDEVKWHAEIGRAKSIGTQLNSQYDGRPGEYSILIDSIDDYWDGSETAVLYLTALMHASLEMTSQVKWARALLFVRENIFERVRALDTEFARLETCVVGLDWTREQLVEMVERRLNHPLTTKLPLGGATWDRFFEEGPQARELVLSFSQHRPRDVLTYSSFAIETAQSHNHDRVLVEDLQDARRRFSDSRLKDLGDEYAENFPQIQLVLSRFYGLGSRFTLGGIEDFFQRLIADPEVRSVCGEWLYNYGAAPAFVRLLYDIGFVGLVSGDRTVFRSQGPRDTTPPPVDSSTDIFIHPAFHAALDLQDVLVKGFDSDTPFATMGLIEDFPGGVDLSGYQAKISELMEDLKSVPEGDAHAEHFERIVGEVIRFCLFRNLGNLEQKVREIDGRVIRDWVASNRAAAGFWEMVRHRYDATQVVIECKNYSDLSAGDFHQVAYYLGKEGGRFALLVFRGELKPHYFKHVKRIGNDKDGLVLMLNDKDLLVFLRQAMRGKRREEHLRDRYDQTVRAIS